MKFLNKFIHKEIKSINCFNFLYFHKAIMIA